MSELEQLEPCEVADKLQQEEKERLNKLTLEELVKKRIEALDDYFDFFRRNSGIKPSETDYHDRKGQLYAYLQISQYIAILKEKALNNTLTVFSQGERGAKE